MADMNSRSMRKKMSRIYLKESYEITDWYNRQKDVVRKGPTPTVARAMHDMLARGFSAEAIYRDLEELGITTCVDVDELAFRVVVTPISHFALCNR